MKLPISFSEVSYFEDEYRGDLIVTEGAIFRSRQDSNGKRWRILNSDGDLSSLRGTTITTSALAPSGKRGCAKLFGPGDFCKTKFKANYPIADVDISCWIL